MGSRGGGPAGGLSAAIASDATDRRGPYPQGMSPFWIWTQAAVVVFVLIGMVIAIVKLV